MADYLPHTDAEIESMLAFLGLSSLDELFAAVPAALRVVGGLDLDDGRPEPDVARPPRGAGRGQPGPHGPAGLLRRGRRLRPRGARRGPRPGRAQRVRDRLHPVPARGGPRGAAGGVRVPDHGGAAGRPADRQRLPLRRGQRPGRGGQPGHRGHRPPGRVGLGGHPPPLAGGARHLRRGHRPPDRRGAASRGAARSGPRATASRRRCWPSATPTTWGAWRTWPRPAGWPTPTARWWWWRPTPWRPGSCGPPASSGPTSWSARASPSARRSPSAAPTSASSPAASPRCADSPAGWSARPSTPRAGAPT